jgi:hypothetical protein
MNFDYRTLKSLNEVPMPFQESNHCQHRFLDFSELRGNAIGCPNKQKRYGSENGKNEWTTDSLFCDCDCLAE